LKPFSTSISNQKKEKVISLLIFFRRKNVKFIVEIWRFTINHLNTVTNNVNFRKLFLYKKLSVLIRTILTSLKILPMNSMLINSNIGDFEFEIEEGETILLENYQKMQFGNYSDNIGSINMQVFYMTKTAIFNYEDLMVKIKNFTF
jgi:hypothetical protein